MHRLVSLMLLIAFVAQHLVCCCSGAFAHSCDHKHHSNEPVCAIEHSHAEEDFHSHGCDHDCDHEHESPSIPDNSNDHNCPCDHSHHHHICIGTHVFFISAPRCEMSQPMLDLTFGFEHLDFSAQFSMAMLALQNYVGVDSGPPRFSCSQRSTLCVYRI